ncbi:unnamed protein product [Dicrocoelium dendriticum]|nr:unnamed protein product [Dicrocoelium dendriticum]
MDQQFNQECIEEHNRVRSLHGCPPLELDVDLAQRAQAHCEKMAANKLMHHRLEFGHGENLCMWEGNHPIQLNGKQLTLRWYGEIIKFNFGQEKQHSSGNFSQIVWKSTQRAGFGRQVTANGCGIYIAAYYAPCGNIVGQFSENVPPPINGVMYVPTDEEKGW